ncbi:MAG: protein translocase subunit SecF [Spirochaetia bacterium]|nr:protein translocase subunit SecF [Spirochaetota bacterium]MCX8096232.1 protein translocase subunit SecF [Spirochaetota bacterium]MDW8112948.1 protein translocase subunit SecF [Spirochaetia bacterium]
MFNFLEPLRKIDFVRNRFYFITFSLILIVIGVILFVVKGGFKQSIDFAGGTRLEVKINDNIGIEDVRRVISATGITRSVTYVGDPKDNIFLISIGVSEDYIQKVETIKQALKDNFKEVVIRGENTVGPRLSQEFFRNAMIMSLVVSFLILVYIGIRFDFIFGLGAIVSLIHDLLISFTVIILFDIEMDISVIAAILTILGYSVTDTVVVYDRIRENFEAVKSTEVEYVVNKSIRQVIVRSVLTSFTTLLIVLAFIIWGPETLKGFSIVLLTGIISGTYSSLFIASPIVIELEKQKLLRQEQAL